MQRIIRRDSPALELLGTVNLCLSGDDRIVGVRSQESHASSPFWVWGLADLQFNHVAADPFPRLCLTPSENHHDCLGFKADSCLRLVIKWPVQTANVQVYLGHLGGSSGSYGSHSTDSISLYANPCANTSISPLEYAAARSNKLHLSTNPHGLVPRLQSTITNITANTLLTFFREKRAQANHNSWIELSQILSLTDPQSSRMTGQLTTV
jgi:hypothetical protein